MAVFDRFESNYYRIEIADYIADSPKINGLNRTIIGLKSTRCSNDQEIR